MNTTKPGSFELVLLFLNTKKQKGEGQRRATKDKTWQIVCGVVNIKVTETGQTSNFADDLQRLTVTALVLYRSSLCEPRNPFAPAALLEYRMRAANSMPGNVCVRVCV